MSGDVTRIDMQSRPDPDSFGPCYECRDDNHVACIGVPCACRCIEVLDGLLAAAVKERDDALAASDQLRAALVRLLAFDGRHGIYSATEAFDASAKAAELVGEEPIREAQARWRENLRSVTQP